MSSIEQGEFPGFGEQRRTGEAGAAPLWAGRHHQGSCHRVCWSSGLIIKPANRCWVLGQNRGGTDNPLLPGARGTAALTSTEAALEEPHA